ncbi:pyrimidine 5'-nucleotidase [Orrella sp. 11846]|uniref:pyrimidine 5'-nucleotidase n=1 Tax=Orrella sp. 11846 TaxID=3409913 RepID=UPI003B5A55BB
MLKRRLTPSVSRIRRSRCHTDPDELVWLFDLDNTLHDTSWRIFDAIRDGMTDAIMDLLDVSEETAHQMRHKYWSMYGATMIGLTKHHGVDPQTFLDRSHDFDVKQLVRAPRGLAQRLRKLQGRKILITNAPRLYATRVLKHLKMLHLFDGIWSVEDMRVFGHHRPKPSHSLLRYVLATEGIPAHRAVLVEDTLSNLHAARAVGLKTVHVFHPGTPFAHPRRGRSLIVDLRVTKVEDLLLSKRPLR